MCVEHSTWKVFQVGANVVVTQEAEEVCQGDARVEIVVTGHDDLALLRGLIPCRAFAAQRDPSFAVEAKVGIDTGHCT